MKKFLSLVLAMIMTLSLVTISAGATEYDELSDKGEITYKEAVAVLNRIGIITGYEDGSFRPETELTRGAAAKIIVSLLIGPDAANALPNASSPYPDVPASHTFAGVISYCKTAGIISGYGDGTFKPANSLTGFAFAKMLLGAIGYKSDIEGFTDTGWTMNVAKIGNLANLFDRLSFDGAAAVNREQACQLALNTLKATMVEYTGGFNVTAGDATVVGAQTRTYVTSNQEYAKNISNRKASNVGNAVSDEHYTVEFGEEHFKDLRLTNEHSRDIGTPAYDEFGRPSNEWSYKKVTIGTFPIEPDFVYTTQVAHSTEASDAAKVRALGLSGYELRQDGSDKGDIDTTLWVNGAEYANGGVTKDKDGNWPLKNADAWNGEGLSKVANIADYTDNGTTVEVYVSEDDADFISDVVVVKTQLMEVKRVASESVSLNVHDDASDADGSVVYGYNQAPIDTNVNDVDINDDCFATLKDMKAGDLVAVVPVAPDHNGAESKYDVYKAYVPETVTGALTNVKQFTKTDVEKAISVTVGETVYNIALWNKDLVDIDGDKVKITRKDVTLYLDEFGNALKAKGVGDTSNWMVIGSYSQGLVNGRLVNYANGWDIGGEELSLNIGNTTAAKTAMDNYYPGDLVYYTNNANSNSAEWKLYGDYEGEPDLGKNRGVFTVYSGDVDGTKADGSTETKKYSIEASNKRILLSELDDILAGNASNGDDSFKAATIESGIKFIYVTVDNNDGEVDSVEFKSGVQETSNEELSGAKASNFLKGVEQAQAAVSLKTKDNIVNENSGVKAVVIKTDSSEASIKDLRYIEKVVRTANRDTEGNTVYVYEGYDYEGNKDNFASTKYIAPGKWARKTSIATPESASGIEGVTADNFAKLTGYGAENFLDTVGRSAAVVGAKITKANDTNKNLLTTDFNNYGPTGRSGDGEPENFNIAKAWDRDKFDLGMDGNDSNGVIDAKGATIIDLREDPNRKYIDSIDQIKDALNGDNDFKEDYPKGATINATILFNDNLSSNDFRTAYTIIIHSLTKKTTSGDASEVTITANDKDGGLLTKLDLANLPEGVVIKAGTDMAFQATVDTVISISAENTTGKGTNTWTWENVDSFNGANSSVSTAKVTVPAADKAVKYVTVKLQNVQEGVDKQPDDKTITIAIVASKVVSGKGTVSDRATTAKGYKVNNSLSTIKKNEFAINVEVTRSDIEANDYAPGGVKYTNWLPLEATSTNIAYNVYLKGTDTIVDSGTASIGSKIGYISITDTNNTMITDESELEVEITGATWDKVKMISTLKNADGKVVDVRLSSATTVPTLAEMTETEAVYTVASSDVRMAVVEPTTPAANGEVTGGTFDVAVKAGTGYGNGTADRTSTGINTDTPAGYAHNNLQNFAADGKNPVVVEIDCASLTVQAATYTVTMPSDPIALVNSKTLTLTAVSGGLDADEITVSENTIFTVKGALSGALDCADDEKPMTVTLKEKDGKAPDITLTLGNDNTVNSVTASGVKVTQNLEYVVAPEDVKTITTGLPEAGALLAQNVTDATGANAGKVDTSSTITVGLKNANTVTKAKITPDTAGTGLDTTVTTTVPNVSVLLTLSTANTTALTAASNTMTLTIGKGALTDSATHFANVDTWTITFTYDATAKTWTATIGQ